MKPITPCLWFDGNAEDAVNFYLSIFEDAKIVNVSRYGDAGPGPTGSVMTILFRLRGQEFLALNGGPDFQFTPAVSFIVQCATQRDIDRFWDELSEGGQPGQCGWLTDKFGVSWQVVPENIVELITAKDPKKSERVIQAVMQMTKLDMATMQMAYEGD